MDLYMPSKAEWEQISKSISDITKALCNFNNLLNSGKLASEHFPEYMDIKIAAKYLKCPVSRIRHMIYIQKILKIYHIDLTTTVFVSKEEMDDLRFKIAALREIEQNKRIK
jgi:hypothetical protein